MEPQRGRHQPNAHFRRGQRQGGAFGDAGGRHQPRAHVRRHRLQGGGFGDDGRGELRVLSRAAGRLCADPQLCGTRAGLGGWPEFKPFDDDLQGAGHHTAADGPAHAGAGGGAGWCRGCRAGGSASPRECGKRRRPWRLAARAQPHGLQRHHPGAGAGHAGGPPQHTIATLEPWLTSRGRRRGGGRPGQNTEILRRSRRRRLAGPVPAGAGPRQARRLASPRQCTRQRPRDVATEHDVICYGRPGAAGGGAPPAGRIAGWRAGGRSAGAGAVGEVRLGGDGRQDEWRFGPHEPQPGQAPAAG
mmetsp:Transcript_53720/g.166813  ORF Transcript_53720/g.166813 Transcript_53720/m.166813 type:complete len:302 (-) Transcript_53720:456-1361(-)